MAQLSQAKNSIRQITIVDTEIPSRVSAFRFRFFFAISLTSRFVRLIGSPKPVSSRHGLPCSCNPSGYMYNKSRSSCCCAQISCHARLSSNSNSTGLNRRKQRQQRGSRSRAGRIDEPELNLRDQCSFDRKIRCHLPVRHSKARIDLSRGSQQQTFQLLCSLCFLLFNPLRCGQAPCAYVNRVAMHRRG